MKNARIYSIAFASLVLGALLYMSCRMNIWFVDWLHLPTFSGMAWNTHNPLVYWTVYCLPDGLWYWALLLVQYKLFQRDSLISRLCAYAAILLPFAIEALQAAGWMQGTFDWWDIFTYLLTLILFFLCVKKDFC